MHLTMGELIGDFLLVTGSVLVLYLLIRKFAWGSITSILDERAAKIANDIDTAEIARKDAEKLANEREVALASAKKEASQIVVDAKELGQVQSSKMIADANEEATRLRNKAQADIDQSKSEAITSVKADMTDLTVQLAEKIIGANIDKNAQSKIIDDYLNQLGEA